MTTQTADVVVHPGASSPTTSPAPGDSGSDQAAPPESNAPVVSLPEVAGPVDRHPAGGKLGVRAAKAGRNAGVSCVAGPPPLLGMVSLTAAREVNPVAFAEAGTVAPRAPESTGALGAIPSSAPSSPTGRPARAPGGHHPAASAEEDPPPQADFATGPEVPRHPQGVGVAGPGGGAAPNLLSTKVAFARMAVSWLRSVSGVFIRLQCPETHRLERPG